MNFSLSFSTDSAAFDGDDKPYEIARILRTIAERAELGETSGIIRDSSGNGIGQWEGGKS